MRAAEGPNAHTRNQSKYIYLRLTLKNSRKTSATAAFIQAPVTRPSCDLNMSATPSLLVKQHRTSPQGGRGCSLQWETPGRTSTTIREYEESSFSYVSVCQARY